MLTKRPLKIEPQAIGEVVTNEAGTVFGIHTEDNRCVLMNRELAIELAMDILLRTGSLPQPDRPTLVQ